MLARYSCRSNLGYYGALAVDIHGGVDPGVAEEKH